MSDRITLTDNNTWNTTHIATVARALSSPERQVRSGAWHGQRRGS